MTEKLEQRYCIKFCQKLGDTQSVTIQKIKLAFEDEAMSVTQVKEWYNRFKEGRLSVESDPRSGRPSTSRNEEGIEAVKTLVMADRRLTVRELAEDVGLTIGRSYVAFVRPCGARDRTYGKREIGSCITIMPLHILRI
jgi:transposase